jgi:hypothetical protein
VLCQNKHCGTEGKNSQQLQSCQSVRAPEVAETTLTAQDGCCQAPLTALSFSIGLIKTYLEINNDLNQT